MVDTRSAPRFRVAKPAKIEDGGMNVACTIRDLSLTGAAVEITDLNTKVIPPKFVLVVPRRPLPGGLARHISCWRCFRVTASQKENNLMLDRRSEIDSGQRQTNSSSESGGQGLTGECTRQRHPANSWRFLSGASDGSCATRRVATFLELPSVKVIHDLSRCCSGRRMDRTVGWLCQAIPSRPEAVIAQGGSPPKRPYAHVATSLVIKLAKVAARDSHRQKQQRLRAYATTSASDEHIISFRGRCPPSRHRQLCFPMFAPWGKADFQKTRPTIHLTDFKIASMSQNIGVPRYVAAAHWPQVVQPNPRVS